MLAPSASASQANLERLLTLKRSHRSQANGCQGTSNSVNNNSISQNLPLRTRLKYLGVKSPCQSSIVVVSPRPAQFCRGAVVGRGHAFHTRTPQTYPTRSAQGSPHHAWLTADCSGMGQICRHDRNGKAAGRTVLALARPSSHYFTLDFPAYGIKLHMRHAATGFLVLHMQRSNF